MSKTTAGSNSRAPDLVEKSEKLRRMTLETCIKARTGHVTSCMSCIEILVALYHGGILRVDPQNPQWEGRDRFILSKGQASPALYAILADMGFFDPKELEKFAQAEGIFGVHLQHTVPGVETTAGSLGLGFGSAAGLALANRMDRKNNLVVTLLGDGELYEGSIWETAMFVGHHQLNNLVTIVDRNYLCTTDFTENLIRLEPLADKWAAFGFAVERINGHDTDALMDVLGYARSRRSTKPLVIIADTVKGQGIECMANEPIWHGAAPTGAMVEKARADLERSFLR
ncbi:transketolase [Paramagnetospirillum caucaseum]|uniref:Transketolase n=1 Tax=Paramagnetospirillum caucaseum TaxID=1244869 RepID=M2ZAY1_9PROT|nr:transketolase [Paramagnetospirillum caucaseum]EME71560.1 transketolase [Paramagnetospirillum caucaseum]